jgi:hypothetical protein
MFSFPKSLHTSQPSSPENHPISQPSLLPTSQPSQDDKSSRIARFPELPRPDLYPGPIDTTPAKMPALFDVLLFDMDEKLLHNEVSATLGSPYLSDAPHLETPLPTVNGITFGELDRVIFSLVVRFRDKPSCNVHFVYDTSSPFTFLSVEVCGIPKPFTCDH